jgi:hypothetical protein
MPLLEVVQTRYVSASIRLTDSTALQLDQYAAFIHASADEVMEQALAYVFSKDRDFQEFLRTSEAQRITPTLRVRRVQPPMRLSIPQRSLFPRLLRLPQHQQLRRDRRHDPAPTRVAKPLRCYAPEEFGHSIPSRVVQVYQRKPEQIS